MKIVSTKNLSDRAQIVNNIIKKTENILDSSVTQFLDATPIIAKYLSIDREATTTGIGFKDDAGPYSGSRKYKLIKDYVMYGYIDERAITQTENENTDTKYDISEIISLHLPNTLIPMAGDRLLLKINNYNVIYTVTEAAPTQFNNKPYYKTVFKVDDTLPKIGYSLQDMINDNLISSTYIYVSENVGTGYSPIITEEFYNSIQIIQSIRDEINDLYMSYYYDENTNTLIYKDDNDINHYLMLLVDLQMDFMPLWDSNGINIILHHENITDKRTLMGYKKNKITKFLSDRKKIIDINNVDTVVPTSIELHSYTYSKAYTSDTFKIDSYFNNLESYKIYDYLPKQHKPFSGLEDGSIDDDFKDQTFISSTAITIEIEDTVLSIMKSFYTNELTLDIIEEKLNDFDMLYDLSTLLSIPILLVIIDLYLGYIVEKENRNLFY